MKNLDVIAEEERAAEAKAEALENEANNYRQMFETAAKGENLPDDFEPVSEAEGRMFSQDELNNILRGRLAKEREKYTTAAAAMSEKISGYETNLAERSRILSEAELRFKAERELSRLGIDPRDETIKLVIGKDQDETFENIRNLSHFQSPGLDPLRKAMGLKQISWD